ncbi:ATP-binding protein [Acidaminobacter hydrogenoformans]|uniref:histidine kinase n=1 Tax=Acidaminobacter hydrogenoformans DSM 2784 TaxID=1120920 RepID=A0A1G5RUZ4_9FIRM|nr:transporter substrate-binding domain-containing protein [Acidaminobacter hydrogenoformans]SCZ77934.1 polar amino acid transport system substrate-binding protein [Acidaminobacter hydrogenoformans DSM 2784]
MRKLALFIFSATLLLILNYINAVVKIDYDLNLIDYFEYSRAFTAEEQKLLSDYGVLIFGGNINDPPLGRYYEETEQHLGLTVDIINALAIELQTNIATKAMVWSDAIEALKNEETNLIDMVPSEARAADFAFSNPIYRLSGAALSPTNNHDLRTLKDLDGVSVAVQRADVVIDKLWEQGIFPEFVYTDHLYEAMALLESGQVEALAGDEPVIRMILNELQPTGSYLVMEERIYNAYTVLAVPKSQSELIPVLNKAILRLRKSGVMTKIEEKWLGYGTAEVQRRSYEKMKHLWLPLLGTLGMLFYAIYLWNLNLKTLVDRRTRELSIITGELESVFDAIQSGIVLVDEQGTLKKVNEEFEGWSGLTEGDPLVRSPFGEPFARLLSVFEGSELNETGTGKTLHSKTASTEVSNGHTIVPLESRDTFVIDNKIFDCRLTTIQELKGLYLMLVTDITLEKLQADKLVHSNKMEAIGRLAAGVAHELRNPLGTIRNSSYLLRATQEADGDTLAATAAIDRAVARAGKIIDNLLNYSRLSTDELSTFSVPDLVSETLSFYRKTMSEHSISPDYSHEGLTHARSNPSALRHVLLNLIHNAIDAMPAGGGLTLRSSLDDKTLRFSISDTGTGIAPEKLGNIFEPFYTDKPVGQGTGLGLYIVYTEIENLGGEIQVQSTAAQQDAPSSGTTFTFHVPSHHNLLTSEEV